MVTLDRIRLTGLLQKSPAQRGFSISLVSTWEQPLQAELRLRAARELVAEGRLVEAEEQLERSRASWRRVGATAYLRETDSVVAAAS